MTSRLYRLLLFLLPGWFREEFGGEMLQVFRDTHRETPSLARLGLWMATARDVAALAWRLHVDAAKQDVVYAQRTLRRTPAFTLAAIATLAVGLGPTVVVANFVYQVILAPLPFPEPDRLVRVWNARPDRSQTRVPLSLPDYMDLRKGESAFEALAAHAGTSVAMVIGGTPRQLQGVLTSAELHDVLRVRTIIGRGLTESDVAPGAPPVLVLGQVLWRNEFGSRTNVIGEVVQVDGRPTTIVGVLEDGFDFPLGSANYWVPLTLDPANTTRGTHYLNATGRLKAGVAMLQAQEALNVIARGLAAAYPDTNAGKFTEVFSLKEQFNGEAPRLLGILSSAIAAVLLIACLNVASLLTVRTMVRGSELAVRTALGATRRRLRRQLVVEHIVLTMLGGVCAAALAYGLHSYVVEQRVLTLPPTAAEFGWQAYALLAGLVLAIGVVFAWITARRSASHSPSASLIGSVRRTSGVHAMRLRQGLVIGEVAMALLLLVTAGLMLRSAARLAAVDPGFRTDGVLTFGVVLPNQTYPQATDRARFAERMTTELRALPGVRQVAAGAYTPMREMRATRRVFPLDQPSPPPGAEPVALDLPVGPTYFEVMGIDLIDGRTFDERDSADRPPVIIVSRELARRFFPNERAIGKQLRFYSSRPGGTPPPAREIVGVVDDVRQDAVTQEPIVQMYTPYAQNSWGFLSFFVLADRDPGTLRAEIQRVVTAVDPMRPARDVLTLSEIVRGSTERQRSVTWVLIALAIMALLLATIGLYGVSATAASARSRELAIRAALGAHPRTLLRLIVIQGFLTSAVGVVAGTIAGLMLTQWLATLLYQTEPRDPMTFAATAVLLLLVATIATYLPARRALSLNPADVLRAE